MVGFWTDNGTEFQNSMVKELVERFKLELKFGPAYSPWCNGLNEKNHHLTDVIIKKVMKQDRSLTLEQAIKLSYWTNNTNANRLGYTPFEIFIGKSQELPQYGEMTIVDHSKFDSERVKKIILNKALAVLELP